MYAPRRTMRPCEKEAARRLSAHANRTPARERPLPCAIYGQRPAAYTGWDAVAGAAGRATGGRAGPRLRRRLAGVRLPRLEPGLRPPARRCQAAAAIDAPRLPVHPGPPPGPTPAADPP